MAALLPFGQSFGFGWWCYFGVGLATGAWHRRRTGGCMAPAWFGGDGGGAICRVGGEASGGWARFDDVDQAIDSVYRHLLLCAAGPGHSD